MTTWNDHPESLVATLLISYAPAAFAEDVAELAFTRACHAVPHTEERYNRLIKPGKTAELRHSSRVIEYAAGAGYHGMARLLTVGDHETSRDAAARWQWQVGYTAYAIGSFASIVPPPDAKPSPWKSPDSG